MALFATILFFLSLIAIGFLLWGKEREERLGRIFIPMSFQESFEKFIFRSIDALDRIIYYASPKHIPRHLGKTYQAVRSTKNLFTERLRSSELTLVKSVQGKRDLKYSKPRSAFLNSIHEYKHQSLRSTDK